MLAEFPSQSSRRRYAVLVPGDVEEPAGCGDCGRPVEQDVLAHDDLGADLLRCVEYGLGGQA